MSALRLRTDEVPPPPPSEKSLRDSNGGVWPPKDRLVALGTLLTTKRAAPGQDASLGGAPFPATPRVPRLESPTPWPTTPEPHPWMAMVSRAVEAGKKHARAGAAVFGAVGLSFAVGALLGARRGRRVRWNVLAH